MLREGASEIDTTVGFFVGALDGVAVVGLDEGAPDGERVGDGETLRRI